MQKNRYSLDRLTAPTRDAVELATLGTFLKHNEEDNPLVTLLQKAAIRWMEDRLSRSLISQTWRMSIDSVPWDDEIYFPRGPLISVDAFNYYKLDDTSTAFSSANYVVQTGNASRLFLKNGRTWPTGVRPLNTLAIDFTSGFGTTEDSIPTPIVAGICQLASLLYEQRSPVVTGTIVAEIEPFINQSCRAYNLSVMP